MTLAKYGRESEYSNKSKNKNAFKLEKVDDMVLWLGGENNK